MKRFLVISVGVAILAGCSGSPTSPTSPAATPAATKSAGATALGSFVVPQFRPADVVKGLADGDVKNGPLDIVRVRIRQGGNGFFASPAGTYRVRINEPIELWVEWASDRPGTGVPRLIVDWSNQTDNIHCGPCLLTQSYRADGRYPVTVTLDDRAGGTTKRTFYLQASGSPVPQVQFVDETIGNPNYSVTMRFLPFNNQDLTITLQNLTIVRVDTGDPLLPPFTFSFGAVPASFFPADLPVVSLPVPCPISEGSDASLIFDVIIEAADGTKSVTEFRGRPYPCF
jgi:hypothetical protein